MGSRWYVGAAGGVILLLAVGHFWPQPAAHRGQGPASDRDEPAAADEPETSAPSRSLAGGSSGQSLELRAAAPVIDRAKRDEMCGLILGLRWVSRPRTQAGQSGLQPTCSPSDLRGPPLPRTMEADYTGIKPKYIQQRVREDFFPLARKCYEDALLRDPKLGGRIVFAFNIVGDEKVGGIVEAVDVLNESTLRDPEVIDCMRQSFLSVSFPPPPGGGTVTVVYPIIFSNDDGG